jgi:hypothetical protein
LLIPGYYKNIKIQQKKKQQSILSEAASSKQRNLLVEPELEAQMKTPEDTSNQKVRHKGESLQQ